MKAIERAFLILISSLLISGVAFGDSISSTFCSVIVGQETTTQTGPNSCYLIGNEGSANYYIASATATSSITPQGFSGYVGSVTDILQVNSLAAGSTTSAVASAQASNTQDFYTAGPPQMGTITFYTSCVGDYGITGGFVDFCGNDVTFLQGSHSSVTSGVICPGTLLPCVSESFAVQLGSIFTIDAAASDEPGDTEDITYSDSLSESFVVTDADGSPVTLYAVPEPSTSAFVWLPLGLLGLGIYRKAFAR